MKREPTLKVAEPGLTISMTHTKPTSSTSQRGSSTFSPRMTTDRRVIICVADIPCVKPNFGISTPLARVNFSFKMLSEGFDAATAGYHVGYGTAAQFTREYKRLFGTPLGATSSNCARRQPQTVPSFEHSVVAALEKQSVLCFPLTANGCV